MTRVLPLLAVLSVGTVASAQPVPPTGAPSRPVFSPYLNLLNNNGNPALNYFGLVVPQQQFQQQASQFQQQLNTANADFQSLQMQNRQIVGGLLDALLPSTGNVATFNNTRGYFNRVGGGSAGTFGGGRPGGMQPSFARPAIGGSGLNRPSVPGVGGGIGGVPR